MAKISARGAEEVDRFEVAGTVYVYTSDRRVLRKFKGLTGYSLLQRNVAPALWGSFKRKMQKKLG